MVGIIGAVAGLLVGVGAANTFSSNKPADNQSSAKVATSKPADLRVLLNSLDKEHVALALNATREGYDGKADFDAVAKSLDSNTVDLGKSVGSVYGADAEKKFLEIWRSHITFFVNYTVATKKGDKAGQDKAVQDLAGYQNAIADFLSGANPNLPRQAVFDLIGEHVLALKSSVDTYAASDFTGAYDKQRAAVVQAQKIADALSGAIVKQYPEKF